MANERKTEQIVRKLLTNKRYFDDKNIVVEEQKSDFQMISTVSNQICHFTINSYISLKVNPILFSKPMNNRINCCHKMFFR
jgi:hypothetical protein